MREYRFSKGWKKIVELQKGRLDVRRSVWELDKLDFDDKVAYLRILGVCWAQTSERYRSGAEFNAKNEAMLQYVEEQVPEKERHIYHNHKNQFYPHVRLADPAFGYSYYNKPMLGKELSRYLLEGVITSAVSEAMTMRYKQSRRHPAPMFGVEVPLEQHQKMQVHSRDADIINFIKFYSGHPDWHKMAWVPYNRGPSHGIWWPLPKESGLAEFVFIDELRDEIGRLYDFPGIEQPIVREIYTLELRYLYDWAAEEGLLTVRRHDEALALSKALHDEAKALRGEWEGIERERMSLENEYLEGLHGLTLSSDFKQVARVKKEKERVQIEYSKKLEVLQARIKRVEGREAEFRDKAHGLKPRPKDRNTKGFNSSYGRQQWKNIEARRQAGEV